MDSRQYIENEKLLGWAIPQKRALSPGYPKPSGLVKESLCSEDLAGGKEEKTTPNQPTSNDLILK